MRVHSYDIRLEISELNYSYTGNEDIKIESDGKTLSLDCVGINVGSVLMDGNATEFSQSEELLEISGLASGNHTLSITFEGVIGPSLTGLYLARTGKTDMFTTQFESTGARRVFPCIDNPAYKAEFQLSLNISNNLEAISNMPVESTKTDSERKTVKFAKTPKMSTYLLYIGVGEFEHKKAKYGDVDVILTAPGGHLSPSDFPLEVAVKCLKVFEDYFGVKYMLPKMHLISVPEFSAGAMENWGALTFREILLYADERTGSRTRKRIASVIAHEIAHQWFGDLVTMKWWNDLWLNESFATFMAYKVIDMLYPEMDAFGELVSTRTSGALSDDSLANSHPIDVDVKDANSVAQIFDQISYGKGASVLRMIEAFVGAENFRKGISNYLKKHSYDNTRGSDLWSSIQEASGLPVNKIMEAWIKMQGYPCLAVTEKGEEIEVSQNRFLLNSGGDGIWPVPLTIMRKSGTDSEIMEKPTASYRAVGFIKANSDSTGFYRTLYSKSLLEGIYKNLEKMGHLDRWGLVNDYYAFLLSGKVTLDEYIDLIGHMKSEKNPLVMEEMASQFLRLHMKAPGNQVIRDQGVSIMKAFLQEIGEKKVPGEDMNISIVRGQLSHQMALMDMEFAAILSRSFNGLDSVDPDVKSSVVFSYALTENNFDGLVEKMESSSRDEDKTLIIGALGWLKGDDLLEKGMKLVLDGKIKRQDCMSFFSALAASPSSRSYCFEHLQEIIEFLKRTFTGSRRPSAALEGIIPLIGMGRVSEIKELLEPIRSPETEKGIEKGLELLGINEAFRERYDSA